MDEEEGHLDEEEDHPGSYKQTNTVQRNREAGYHVTGHVTGHVISTIPTTTEGIFEKR